MSGPDTGVPANRADACRPGRGLHRRDPDPGDLVVVLLADTLARMCDRLAADGFARAAELVADLADIAHDYADRLKR